MERPNHQCPICGSLNTRIEWEYYELSGGKEKPYFECLSCGHKWRKYNPLCAKCECGSKDACDREQFETCYRAVYGEPFRDPVEDP